MSSSEDELYDIDWGASDVFDCFDYVDPYVLSPQIEAVLRNDVVELRRLLQDGNSVNINDNRGNTPLHHAVRSNANLTSIFDCLIEVEDIRLDAVNFYGETPLILALKNVYYIRKLLQKGADPNLRYPNGDSLLHHTKDVDVVRLLLEHGADINAQARDGQTPLFYACKVGLIKLVHTYLYYGADVTITDNCGFLPYDICRENVDSLFYLTFDEHTEVSLLTLYKAIENKSPYLKEIVKITRNIIYTRKQLKELAAQIFRDDSDFVSIFADPFVKNEFGYSVQIFRLMNVETQTCDMITIEDFWFMLSYCYILNESLFSLLDNLRQKHSLFLQQFAIQFVCYCASRGYEITSQYLDKVYLEFGFCELYRMLLNIAKIRNHCCNFDSYAGHNFMAFLTYDLNLGINMIERFQEEDLECFSHMLKFFNMFKFKDKFPQLFEEYSYILGKASAVPSLVELSRNTARNFIISKFKVEDNVQFLTVINHIPIPNVVKEIIIYQKQIYNL